MKTIIKYNLTPNDGRYATVTSDVEKIVRDYQQKKIAVDELVIEVNDVFSTKTKLRDANKSFNGNGVNNVVQIK